MQISDVEKIEKHLSNKSLEKINLYKLTSERFQYRDMSQSATECIENAKKKQRSDLEISEWYKLKYCQESWCSDMINSVSNSMMSYEDYENLTTEEFQTKYEKLNKPLIIKGVTSNWTAQTTWNFEVY